VTAGLCANVGDNEGDWRTNTENRHVRRVRHGGAPRAPARTTRPSSVVARLGTSLSAHREARADVSDASGLARPRQAWHAQSPSPHHEAPGCSPRGARRRSPIWPAWMLATSTGTARRASTWPPVRPAWTRSEAPARTTRRASTCPVHAPGLDAHPGASARHYAQRTLRALALTTSAMLHVCRRNLRNELEQDGTRRDAAGDRLPSIPGGYEVRARFCWEFRTARRGFDSRRLHSVSPGKVSAFREACSVGMHGHVPRPLRLGVPLVVGGGDDEPPQDGGVRVVVLPAKAGGLPVPERRDGLPGVM
jgi:hypothetical protein